MNIKLLVSLLAGATFTASLTGCAIAPGPYLDTDRLEQTPSPESVAVTPGSRFALGFV